VDDALAATGKAGPMDAWLAAAVGQQLAAARSAYETSDLRAAANAAVYAVPDLLRWYARRGGGNAKLLRQVVQDWAKALSPMVPHLAEEMHHRAGGHGFATTSAFPEPAAADGVALAAEEYLRSVLEDIQTVRKLANVAQPRSLTLYATPRWKSALAAKALRMTEAAGGKFPMGAFMSETMADPQMRTLGKAVQAYAAKLPQQVTQFTAAQRRLLADGADESAILAAAAPFIAAEVGLPAVQVHAADDPAAPESPKKGVASPLKPGIAME